MRFYSHLCGRRKRPDRHFAGRGAVDGGDCPDARSGENHDHQGAAAERTSLGRVDSPLHAAGAYQLRRRREAILEREAALRLFVRIGSPRVGRPNNLRLVEMWQRTATAGHRLRDNLRLHLSNRTEGRGFMALFDASPQTPSPASRQSSRATPSRIERQSMIVLRKPLKAAARPAIGRAISSSANAPGPCSSCTSVSHG